MQHTITSLFKHWLVVTLLVFCLSGEYARGQDEIEKINQTDELGRKTGLWKKSDDAGTLIYTGRFDAGFPQGEFTYYYPDGKKKAIVIFSNDGKKSLSTTFHNSGKIMSEGSYSEKQKDSLWSYYDVNGILVKEEFYIQNKRNGTWKTYYDTGGVAEEVNWENDVEHGPWLQYFSSGVVKMEGTFDHGMKEGPVTFYYPTGRTRVTGQYKGSFKTGEWFYMNEKSKVIRIETYEAGRLIEEEVFESEE